MVLFTLNESSKHRSHRRYLHAPTVCRTPLVTIDVLQCNVLHSNPLGRSHACRPDHAQAQHSNCHESNARWSDALINITHLKGLKSGHKDLTALDYKRVTINSIVRELLKSFTNLE